MRRERGKAPFSRQGHPDARQTRPGASAEVAAEATASSPPPRPASTARTAPAAPLERRQPATEAPAVETRQQRLRSALQMYRQIDAATSHQEEG
ncbi:MAG: hypothetical protein HYY02_02080 [Chloroflexi bacterium]|nr:hypothetical protein [Chloroflexota bacterium]